MSFKGILTSGNANTSSNFAVVIFYLFIIKSLHGQNITCITKQKLQLSNYITLSTYIKKKIKLIKKKYIIIIY